MMTTNDQPECELVHRRCEPDVTSGTLHDGNSEVHAVLEAI